LIVLAAVSVLPPSGSRAVVAVSRLGSGVRLLPQGLAFSPLPLARRITLPRESGAAILAVPATVPLAGGARLPVELSLRLEGAGPLPVDAVAVRASGWEAAWRQRLEGALHLETDEAAALLAATPLWREIFPDAPAANSPDVTARLAALFTTPRLASVTITAAADPAVVRAAARQAVATRVERRGRLVLLGLDALDWQLVDELVGRGLMPNLARLEARGAHAVLEVPRPLISPVVWTTIATGQPPEVHGVLDFLESNPDGGNPRPVSSASRKVPALWELAAAAGRTSSVIGWWATFPAQAVPGSTVYSDRLTEQLLGLSARTPFLADPPEADRIASRLVVRAADLTAADLAPIAPVSDAELARVRSGEAGWDDPIGGLAKLMAATITVERITEHELTRGTGVVLSYLEGTDTVGHLYAPYRPPAMPGTDPLLARRFAAVVDRYYARVDRWIGRVLDALGSDDTVVIVSDHGFSWFEDRPRVPSGAHTATAVMWHRPEGAFIAAGPAVSHTPQRRRMHVFEVGPALLALAGLPAAADMPRRCPDWLMARPPGGAGGPVHWAALVPRDAPRKVELPPEARAEELAKLRALGYLAGGETGGESRAAAASAAAPTVAAPAPAAPPQPQFNRAEARRLTNLGTSRASQGERAAAEQAFHQALNADPTYAAAHYNLNLMLRNSGRLDEADAEFWIAVELGVADREMAVVRLALDYMQRGDPRRAEQVLAEGRRRLPEAALVWLNSGVFLGDQGRFEEARTCLERAVRLAPANPIARKNLGVALLALGDRDGARRELAESLRLDPAQDDVRRQLAALGN
jgi:Tfp pilus assembly protein PilF